MVLLRGQAMLLRMLVLSAAFVALACSMFTASPSFSNLVGKDFSRLDFASNAITGCALLSPPARPSVKTWATSWPSVAPTSNSKELEARSSTLGHVHPQQIRESGPKGWYDMNQWNKMKCQEVSESQVLLVLLKSSESSLTAPSPNTGHRTAMLSSKQHQMRRNGVARESSTRSTPWQSCMAL